MTPEPTISELLDAAKSAVQGSGDKNADYVRGSDYDAFAGAGALIWVREARRDTDLFKATRFHDADGADLTDLVQRRYGISRVLDTRGAGTATISRPSSGVADKVYVGTRLRIGGVYYRCTSETAVSSTAIGATFTIEAVEPGIGVAVQATSGIVLEDPLVDPTWTVSTLTCVDGTVFEKANALRARVISTRSDARVGQKIGMETACKNAGAVNVVILRSNYAGDDSDTGLNACYVSDLGFETPSDLIRDCFFALRKTKVCGTNLQVLPMTRVVQDLDIDVYLSDDPVKFDLNRIYAVHKAAIYGYFGSSGVYTYSLNGIEAALCRASLETQDVVINTPSVDGVIWDNTNLPSILNRYVPGTVTIRYHGP